MLKSNCCAFDYSTMAVCQPTYEDFRRQRLEENKKRMEDLNLTLLSHALRNASPKPSPVKQGRPRLKKEIFPAEVRRSPRNVNKAPPEYKEVKCRKAKLVCKPQLGLRKLQLMPKANIEHLGTPRSCRRRTLFNRVYASDEARSYAIEKAKELHSSLEPEFPSFVKPMLQSHVTGGFWLGLPVQFCKLNLPKHDSTVTLVDEDEDEYQTVYLPRKTGLSGGWKGFAVAHELLDGDALVFQLVKPTTFKVFIIRASGSENTNGQMDHKNFGNAEEQMDLKNLENADEQMNRKNLDASAKRIRCR